MQVLEALLCEVEGAPASLAFPRSGPAANLNREGRQVGDGSCRDVVDVLGGSEARSDAKAGPLQLESRWVSEPDSTVRAGARWALMALVTPELPRRERLRGPSAVLETAKAWLSEAQVSVRWCGCEVA